MDNSFKSELSSNRCNHNPNEKDFATLQLISKRCMVHPQEYLFVCKNCKRSFKFIKGEDGGFQGV